MPLQRFASELLTFLERREERLLSWGFHNVRWTITEAAEAFDSEAPSELSSDNSPYFIRHPEAKRHR